LTYCCYEKSSLNRSMLKQAHEICPLPFLVPTRVGGTRWPPHAASFTTELQGYCIYMQQIQNPNDPAYHKDSSIKAKNYLMLLTSADVTECIHRLLGILRCLGCLSEQFQHRQVNVSVIMNEIQASVDLLNKYNKLRKILEGDTTIFQGEKPSDRNSAFMAARYDMLTSLITSLKKRFIDMASTVIDMASTVIDMVRRVIDMVSTVIDMVSTVIDMVSTVIDMASSVVDMASTVLQNSWILYLKLWPAEYTGNEFGDTAVGALAQSLEKTLWEAEVEPTNLEDVWTILTYHLYNMISSAGAGRGFSQVKLIKTDWRSFTEDHLTNLVVQLQSEFVSNFNPEQTINRILTTGAAVLMGITTQMAAADDIEQLDEEHIQKLIDQIHFTILPSSSCFTILPSSSSSLASPFCPPLASTPALLLLHQPALLLLLHHPASSSCFTILLSSSAPYPSSSCFTILPSSLLLLPLSSCFTILPPPLASPSCLLCFSLLLLHHPTLLLLLPPSYSSSSSCFTTCLLLLHHPASSSCFLSCPPLLLHHPLPLPSPSYPLLLLLHHPALPLASPSYPPPPLASPSCLLLLHLILPSSSCFHHPTLLSCFTILPPLASPSCPPLASPSCSPPLALHLLLSLPSCPPLASPSCPSSVSSTLYCTSLPSSTPSHLVLYLLSTSTPPPCTLPPPLQYSLHLVFLPPL
ncbi:hypothetical protein Hamer_G025362, partial [Homarus americanus]